MSKFDICRACAVAAEEKLSLHHLSHFTSHHSPLRVRTPRTRTRAELGAMAAEGKLTMQLETHQGLDSIPALFSERWLKPKTGKIVVEVMNRA